MANQSASRIPFALSVLGSTLPIMTFVYGVGLIVALAFGAKIGEAQVGLVVALALTLGVLLALTCAVVFWFVGSSLGSWTKNFTPLQGGQGSAGGGAEAPVQLPVMADAAAPPTAPSPPAPGDKEPDEPEPDETAAVPAIAGIGPSTDPSTASKRVDIPYDGKTPAAIRYNNPGAQYPSAAAAEFGQTGYGVIGGNHKIARFPHPVNGAAANIDLLYRKYRGETFRDAGSIWTRGEKGHSVVGKPGWDRDGTLDDKLFADENALINFLQGMAHNEAGRASPVTDPYWRAAIAMWRAGSADAYLAAAISQAPAESTERQPIGADLLAMARPHIGEKYVFGAQVPKDDPDCKGPWDCAELVSWAIYQVAGIAYGWTDDASPPAKGDAYTGAFQRDAKTIGRSVSVQEAAATPGGILLRFPGSGVGHVVLCDGKGGTIEAKSTREGVVADKVSGRRWDIGILIPGISYDAAGSAVVSSPANLYAIGQPNMRPDTVKLIQAALAENGFTVAVDGEYGPQTARAVAEFQRQAGIVEDGEVGQQTAGELGVSLS